MKASAPQKSSPQHALHAGLDLISSAVVLVDSDRLVRHLNPAAENLFAVSERQLAGQPLSRLLGEPPELGVAFASALANNWSYTCHNIALARGAAPPVHLDCTVTAIDAAGSRLLLEFRPIDQQLKVVREERLIEQQQANRELIRNLAHEIKNPLGGIRGSAQLLEHELAPLANAAELKEYTQVIIKEADRLQELMQRLLSAHGTMQPAPVNVHEVLERVRRLIGAEFPDIIVRRDYDSSLPELTADREQLIQAVLNVARNAAQAVCGRGEIVFRTRALRQVTIAKRRHRLGLQLQVIDNGPGIAADIRERIFYPLVSGREGGSGLGLSLAQSFIEQHLGAIDVESEPGRTVFSIVLPLPAAKAAKR